MAVLPETAPPVTASVPWLNRPPPLLAASPVTAVLLRVAVPSGKYRPPPAPALLPARLQLVSVSTLQSQMPPPYLLTLLLAIEDPYTVSEPP